MVDDGEHLGHERPPRAAWVGLGAWILVVAVAMAWSPPIRSGVDAPPFYGRWELHDVLGLLPALVFAGAVAWAWPSISNRLTQWWLAAASGAASVVWAALLAASGGLDRLWTPLTNQHLYFGVGAEVDASTFLRTYVDRLERYPIHVKGHPPGMPLLLRAFDALGLGGPKWAAAIVLAVWGLGIAAVVIAVSLLAGTDAARRTSAAVAFLPAVVFAATTFDALFAGVMAMAIASLVGAAVLRGWRSDVAAVAGGLLVAAAFHLSYGLVPLGLIPLVVMVRHRRVRPVILAGVGAAVVFAAFVANGFWWLDGLNATRGFYADGIARFRPYGYFVFFGNPAALALCVGPFAAMGLAGSVSRRGALLRSPALLVAAAAAVAVAAADLTGLSNAETERIWLPFMPWIAVAAAYAVAPTLPARRLTLGATLLIGILIQATLVTPW